MTGNLTLIEGGGFTEIALTAERLASADVTELAGTLRSLEGKTGAVVLRSECRDFCLGRAPTSPPTDPDSARREVIHPVLDLYAAVTQASFPMIAAVHGRAYGLGFALAVACDVLLATEGAAFALPEIDAGFAPLLALGQLIHTMPRHLVVHAAATARPIGAVRLWNVGVIAELTGEFELHDNARDLAKRLATRSAVRDLKAFMVRREEDVRRTDAAHAAEVLAEVLAANGIRT